MTIARLGVRNAELNTLTDLEFYGNSTYPTVSTTKFKNGTKSYRNTGSNAMIGFSFGSVSAVRAGYWLNHNSGGSNYYASFIFTLMCNGAPVSIKPDFDNKLFLMWLGYAYNSNSTLQVATGPMGDWAIVDMWRHVGITYKADASNGFCSFYVDGAQKVTYTGDTTIYRQSTTTKVAATCDGVFVCGSTYGGIWNSYVYSDDIYADSIVGEADAPPPGKQFLFSLADAAGANAQWTPLSSTNISNVDDPLTAINDGDTTYNKALVAGKKDTFNTAALVGLPPGAVINAVTPIAVARKLDTTQCQLKLHTYDGSTYVNSAVKELPTAYNVIYGDPQVLHPSGVAWTESNVNSVQAGVESVGSFA